MPRGTPIVTSARIELPMRVTMRPARSDLEPWSKEWHLERAYKIRKIFNASEDIFKPAQYILQYCIKNPPEWAKQPREFKIARLDAELLIWSYARLLMRKGFYEAAAILLWGDETFNPNPHATQLVWNGLCSENKNLIMGGGSLSKSYSGGVLHSMWFLEDPEWTCYKIISVTGEHNKRNIYAHIKNLLRSTIIPVVDRKIVHERIPNLTITATSIQANDDDKQGIHMVLIPPGDDGKGRLRGFHPVPRRGPDHPRFGRLSRVGVFMDEAEEIPEGAWEDVNNILLTETEDESHVRVTAATNPKDRSSRFGQMAEPTNGWASLDIDRDETWKSALGWNVIRLDGAKCENVIEGREVYPGLQTKEGFDNLIKLGTNSPEYFTMARGWFPEASLSSVIINETLFDRSKGIYHFTGAAIPWAGYDVAFEGNDHIILTSGRVGEASAWTDARGNRHVFREARRVIQVDQQFELQKEGTIELSRTIRRRCNDLGVKPAWLGGDRTGNGTGVHDALCSLFGPDVLGVNFAEAATDLKILDDDTKAANEVYHDIISEMAFAVRRFMETDTIKLHTGVNWNKLEKETTNRRYLQVGRGFLRIESKKEYKRRNANKSPDRFDSLIIGVHRVRVNGGIFAQQVSDAQRKRANTNRGIPKTGIVDILDLIDMSVD